MGKSGKENLPEGFGMPLAITDALPVLFFCTGAVAVHRYFDSTLFLAGAAVCTLAGCGKVLWKLLIAAAKKDVRILSRQLRYFMPLGFSLMLASLVVDRRFIDLSAVLRAVTALPSAVFFAVGIVGMAAMAVFSKKLDGEKARSNWIEELTNLTAQAAFLAGILFLH